MDLNTVHSFIASAVMVCYSAQCSMQYLSVTERIVLVLFSFSITGGIALFSYASCNERGSKEIGMYERVSDNE